MKKSHEIIYQNQVIILLQTLIDLFPACHLTLLPQPLGVWWSLWTYSAVGLCSSGSLLGWDISWPQASFLIWVAWAWSLGNTPAFRRSLGKAAPVTQPELGWRKPLFSVLPRWFARATCAEFTHGCCCSKAGRQQNARKQKCHKGNGQSDQSDTSVKVQPPLRPGNTVPLQAVWDFVPE